MLRRPRARHAATLRATRHAATLTVLALLLAACSSDDAPGPVPAPDPAPDAAPDAAQELTVLHPFMGGDDLAGFRDILAAFTAQHPHIQVREEGVRGLASIASERISSALPPDVIVHDRPWLLEPLARQGLVLPLDDIIGIESLRTRTVPGLLDPVTLDGRLHAVPLRLSIDSLVWYSPRLFAANGYAIPVTWDDMVALGDRMLADGVTPWCIGIEAGPATGWVAADWVEDIVLRALGGDDYERWVAGGLEFASEPVQGALERYLVPIWTDDEAVLGGRARIAQEPFTTSATGIVGDDPSCGMHRQGLLIEHILADLVPDATPGVDFDRFLLPGITPGDRPVIGSMHVAARTSDAPAAAQFLQFLTTLEPGTAWVGRNGSLPPFAPTGSPGILATVTSFHLDGSDRMPSAVGSDPAPGSFWTEMTAWISGQQTLGAALEAIDARFAAVNPAR